MRKEEIVGSEKYNYYIRPYIPFLTVNEFSFNDILKLNKNQKQRDGVYPRFFLEKISKTWFASDPIDKWFDHIEVYRHIKGRLINRITGKKATKVEKPRKFFNT